VQKAAPGAVVRKYSIMQPRERESTRDVARQGSDGRRRRTILRADGAKVFVGGRGWQGADQERRGPSPCADAQCCSAESTISEWIASVSRQNNLHPARCHRIIVSGRTTTKASRQLKSFERIASKIRDAASIRRGLTPRSSIGQAVDAGKGSPL
jgi:hypothetical protein